MGLVSVILDNIVILQKVRSQLYMHMDTQMQRDLLYTVNHLNMT